jgi:hypothetical protein
MTDIRDLRKKASLCRKAASVRTDGAGDTDSVLIDLAERLERQAERLERERGLRRPRPGGK